MTTVPSRQGLYDPSFEHDACGVAFVANMHGDKSRDIVDKGIQALVNLEHRGAAGAEKNTGDGAGILIQMNSRPPANTRLASPCCRLPEWQRSTQYATSKTSLKKKV